MSSGMWAGWSHLVVLLISFIVGALCGFFLAALVEPGDDLRSYLNDYLSFAAQGDLRPSFLAVIWDCIRWPLIVILFGFTAFGVVAIPMLFLLRGFLLSYAAVSFGALLGSPGAAAAAALFCGTVLLVLPVLFLFGCEGLRVAAARLPGAAASGEKRLHTETILPGVGLLAVAAALQWTVVPIIFTAVCARLFT